MGTTTIGIKIDDETRRRLKELAEARNRTAHWIVKEAVSEYLTREEVVEKERIEDQQRWDHYVLTGEAVDHDRVRDWLQGLADGQDDECPR